MKINRTTGVPSKWSFGVNQINDFVKKYYNNKKLWIDPFCGKFSPVPFEHRNDINTERKAKYHLKAPEFTKLYPDESVYGVIYDPPYSTTRIKRSYKSIGIEQLTLDETKFFYKDIEEEIYRVLEPGGICLKFAWNSSSIIDMKSMKILEVLVVNHGGLHPDTLCTAQRKREILKHIII